MMKQLEKTQIFLPSKKKMMKAMKKMKLMGKVKIMKINHFLNLKKKIKKLKKNKFFLNYNPPKYWWENLLPMKVNHTLFLFFFMSYSQKQNLFKLFKIWKKPPLHQFLFVTHNHLLLHCHLIVFRHLLLLLLR